MNSIESLFNLLEFEGKLETLLCYAIHASVDDPYEQNKTTVYMNPLPVKAIVSEIGFSGLHWKYFGQLPTGSIQIVVDSKDKDILLTAGKIEYDEKFYTVYKDDSKNFQYIDRKEYTIFILGRKALND